MPRIRNTKAPSRLERFLGRPAVSLRGLIGRRPGEPQAIEVNFDRSTYLVRVRRHRQARRYTLRVDAVAREIVLTIPVRGSLRDAREFAQKQGAWIAARLKRLPQAAPFAHGIVVPFRGAAHRIEHRTARRGTVWIEDHGGDEPLICVTGEPPHHNRRIGDFMMREAHRALEAASRRYAHELGVTFKRISLRDPSSRWGSCSNAGVLSFSWRLIMAPPFVLDYLAAHEVAHLVELNHSPRFWRLLRTINPDSERAKAWLDAHGTDLHRYGVAAASRDNEPQEP
jgi:predicted metal-dependent hydrolase